MLHKNEILSKKENITELLRNIIFNLYSILKHIYSA
jgi:hypothetical protein